MEKHYTAAFINEISENGTKQEALDFLQETWNELCEANKLKKTVADLFKLLDITEESDSGRVFNPIYISCGRVLLTEKLAVILKEMRNLSHV